jgi:hypothetical protein
MSLFVDNLSSVLMAAPGSIALPIERDFLPTVTIDFAANNWPLAIGIVCAYLSFITVGSLLMSRMEKPFDLRMPLAGWNALLCVFSFTGMCKTVRFNLFRHPFEIESWL